MDDAAGDRQFTGGVPGTYDALMVPLLFEHYANDLAVRAARLRPHDVLETAAGTGAVTRQLAQRLPVGTRIVATDLNPPMLARAAAVGTAQPVAWQPADAQALPFPDASFDVVACQFGAMFFPDRPRAFAEARRVLRAGGTLLFNTWDELAENDFAQAVTDALAGVFPSDPPRFMARVPHGYFDTARIAIDLSAAGFTALPAFERLPATSRAASAALVAAAYCQGTPMRAEIEARGAPGLEQATLACERLLAGRYGGGPVEGRMRAIVVEVPA
jgi:SAM-dependent methyltransferase